MYIERRNIMEQITIGQIALAISFLVGLIGGISYLKTHIEKWISESLKDQFAAIDTQMNTLQKHIDDIDMATCKNFLVARLAEAEKGLPWDEIETERFYEQYEHYTKHGGNSYIVNKVDKLKEQGYL